MRKRNWEKKYNLYATKTMLSLAIVYTIVYLLNEFGIFYVEKNIMRCSELVVAIFSVVPFIYVRKTKFDEDARIKYVLIACIMFITFFVGVTLNLHAILFFMYPMLISMHYHSRRLNVIAVAGTVIVAFSALTCAYMFGTFDFRFVIWTVYLFNPEIVESFPNIVVLEDALNISPAVGITIFYGLPQALTIIGFSYVTTSVSKLRTQNQADWIEEVKGIDEEREQALNLADAKSMFLASMSHEIRTPINAILGMNTAIMRESNEDVIREYASDVDDAGKMLLSLINDILDYSKIDAGKMEFTNEKYKSADLIMSCYNLVEKRALDKGLEIIIEADPMLPTAFEGDVRRVEQIAINLLTNAVKYTKKGTVTFRVSALEFTEISNVLVISVIDTGIGIKEEDRVKLFAPFDRIEQKRNANIEGTGLGLAITNKLVKAMNGTITVNSTYGKGSEFTVTIPQKVADKAPLGLLKKDSYTKQSDKDTYNAFEAPKAKILIVDDVKMNLKVAKTLLASTKVNVDMATSADESIKMVKEREYDLILMDHAMPGKDGIQALKEIRELVFCPNHSTPIVVMTANYTKDAKDAYMAEGFDDYLSKPFTVEEIQSMVKKYIPYEKLNK